MWAKLKKEKGFTIVEVMIVLAIAGLILLIVLLAVPALQRNSRNTQRKDDVSKILAALSEWQNNHNGSLPSSSDFDDAIANADLGIYDGKVNQGTGFPGDTESVNVALNYKCNGEEGNPTSQNRSVAALYQVETSSDPQKQCD